MRATLKPKLAINKHYEVVSLETWEFLKSNYGVLNCPENQEISRYPVIEKIGKMAREDYLRPMKFKPIPNIAVYRFNYTSPIKLMISRKTTYDQLDN